MITVIVCESATWASLEQVYFMGSHACAKPSHRAYCGGGSSRSGIEWSCAACRILWRACARPGTPEGSAVSRASEKALLGSEPAFREQNSSEEVAWVEDSGHWEIQTLDIRPLILFPCWTDEEVPEVHPVSEVRMGGSLELMK